MYDIIDILPTTELYLIIYIYIKLTKEIEVSYFVYCIHDSSN